MATRLDPALNPDIFGMQPKPLRGAPSTSISEEVVPERKTPMQAAEGRLQKVESDIERTLKEQAEFAGKEALFKAERGAEEARGRAGILEEQATKMREAEAPIRVAEEERMRARFEPTRENATEMAALYSLIGVVGFAIGSGGKRSAMNAMSAMNGMLEGYRQGSSDRYNSEKRAFDANLKNLSDTVTTLTTRLERVARLAAIDKAQAEQELSVTLAESGADFVKENIKKFGLPATLQYLQQVRTAAQRAVDKEREFQSRADAAATKAEEDRRKQQQARDDREYLIRLAASLKPTKETATGIKPPAKVQESYITNNILSQDLQGLTDRLKDPKLVQQIKDYRIEAFLTEEGKALNQLLDQSIPSELRTFLTQVRDIRNNYYLNISGKAVTGAEALRNYGTVPQPGDSPEVMRDKITGMKGRVDQFIKVQKGLYGLPDLSDAGLQGMRPNVTPGETYPMSAGGETQTPAAAPAVPPRPADVPTNARYSPSQNTWWWQEGTEWKSKKAE